MGYSTICFYIVQSSNYTGLRGLVTKSRIGESDRFCDAENESDFVTLKMNLAVEFPQHVRFLSNLVECLKNRYFGQFHEFIVEKPNFLKYFCQWHRIVLTFTFQIHF